MCSAWWHREPGGLALLNKQPLHPLQLKPNTASSASVRRPFGKAEHKVLPKPEGEGEGKICCWLSENPWHVFGYGMKKEAVEGLAT